MNTLHAYLDSVGPGWRNLLMDTQSALAPLIPELGDQPFRIDQVKEKFGGLRIYLAYETEAMTAVIDKAEELSLTICEQCGRPGTAEPNKRGWVKTLCPACREAT